jgi:tRNA-binding protein
MCLCFYCGSIKTISSAFPFANKSLVYRKIEYMTISSAEFEKVDIRAGTVIAVDDFPKARKPAFKLQIDFGAAIGIKRSSAQVTAHYTKDDLLNRKVIAVVNFPPKQIADFISECLVLGVYDENNDVILLQPGLPVNNGMKIG